MGGQKSLNLNLEVFMQLKKNIRLSVLQKFMQNEAESFQPNKHYLPLQMLPTIKWPIFV